MKHRKRAIAAVTVCMLAVTSVPAFAYSPTGPGASPEAGRYSEEEDWQDSRIMFWNTVKFKTGSGNTILRFPRCGKPMKIRDRIMPIW